MIVLKKLISIILATAVMIGTIAYATEFSDMVDSRHWAYPALSYVTEQKIVQGFDDNTIRPNEKVTRAQLAAIITRMDGGENAKDDMEFADVSKDSWYYEYFKYTYKTGLMLGDDAGRMNPDRNITRQEVFAVIYRWLGLEPSKGAKIPDIDAVADWAKTAVTSLYSEGYISGDASGKVNPYSDITRAELSQIVYNIHIKNEKKAESDSKQTSEKKPTPPQIRSSGTAKKHITEPAEENTEQEPSISDENQKPVVRFDDGDNYAEDIFE